METWFLFNKGQENYASSEIKQNHLSCPLTAAPSKELHLNVLFGLFPLSPSLPKSPSTHSHAHRIYKPCSKGMRVPVHELCNCRERKVRRFCCTPGHCCNWNKLLTHWLNQFFPENLGHPVQQQCFVEVCLLYQQPAVQGKWKQRGTPC